MKIEKTEYGKAILDAINRCFVGVTVVFEKRSKHNAAIFTANGTSRTITFPASPSDWRGAKNCATDVKRMIRAMGAQEKVATK